MADTAAPSLSEQAMDAALKKAPARGLDLDALIERCYVEFVDMQLDRFPWYCYEARRQNHEARKVLDAVGNPGGWSESKDFKLDFIIPRDLYLFMVNLVYKDFWAESNEKIWRKFLTGICRGDDAMDWLKALKIYYGRTSELQKTGEV